MNAKLILIGEDKDYLKEFQSKFKLLRMNDTFEIFQIADVKSMPKSAEIIFINCADYNDDSLSKLTDKLTQNYPEAKIIQITENSDILYYYKKGVYDFIPPEVSGADYYICILNCLKYQRCQKVLAINRSFINTTNTIHYKTGLYTRKALKDAFVELGEKDFVKNGTFAILTLDETTKTKVSTNRLAGVLKKNLRTTDIIAAGIDKYYIIFCDTSINNAKCAVQKISDIMGNDFSIRAGLCSIGIDYYDSIETRARNSLKSAIVKNTTYDCLDEQLELENYNDGKHKFKLFQKSYDNKLNNVIKPVFFRFEKEYGSGLADAQIVQYTNEIESMFCIKGEKAQSELILQYNGIAKLDLTISHSGLETPETTKIEIPLNKLNEKELTKYLKQLGNEYKEGAKNA